MAQSEHSSDEANRLSGRLKRYVRVGTNMSGVAARLAGAKIFGTARDHGKEAEQLRLALGGLKGPLMKVAQLVASIPDALPPEYSAALMELQANAPAMGWPFVRRRMAAELGKDWQSRFESFERKAAAAASLGQVHRAVSLEGQQLACKLQYPEMQSAVEADLQQLKLIFAIHRRMDPVIDTSEIIEEIGARLREELDYVREAGHIRLYTHMLATIPEIHIPEAIAELSTTRLLTMSWLEGLPLLDFKASPQDARNAISRNMFNAWWVPFCRFGVIHGDPHLGNYTVTSDKSGEPEGINLLDFGCIRIFPPSFVGGVVDLYQGLQNDNHEQIVHAYETWGFQNLDNELIDILNIWAKFIYGPMLEDRVRALADGINPTEFGRKQAFLVHQALKKKGPVRLPREFVFMDRAAIGLGSVFLHLRAELNFHRLFNEALDGFSQARLMDKQQDALDKSGIK